MASQNKSGSLRIAFLAAGLLTPVILLILFAIGYTAGEEFSPDDFSRRRFSYNRVPVFNWTVIGKQYIDTTPALEQTLLSSGLIQDPKNSPQVWHLSQDSGSGSGRRESHDCDARFLVRYLDLTDDEGEQVWIGWNAAYPESAKIFWPRIAEMSRDEMYLKVPDLMRFALETQADQPIPFANRLDQLAAEAYAELGRIDLATERSERGEQRLKKSLDLHASESVARELADHYRQTGRENQATSLLQQQLPTPAADSN